MFLLRLHTFHLPWLPSGRLYKDALVTWNTTHRDVLHKSLFKIIAQYNPFMLYHCWLDDRHLVSGQTHNKH